MEELCMTADIENSMPRLRIPTSSIVRLEVMVVEKLSNFFMSFFDGRDLGNTSFDSLTVFKI